MQLLQSNLWDTDGYGMQFSPHGQALSQRNQSWHPPSSGRNRHSILQGKADGLDTSYCWYGQNDSLRHSVFQDGAKMSQRCPKNHGPGQLAPPTNERGVFLTSSLSNRRNWLLPSQTQTAWKINPLILVLRTPLGFMSFPFKIATTLQHPATMLPNLPAIWLLVAAAGHPPTTATCCSRQPPRALPPWRPRRGPRRPAGDGPVTAPALRYTRRGAAGRSTCHGRATIPGPGRTWWRPHPPRPGGEGDCVGGEMCFSHKKKWVFCVEFIFNPRDGRVFGEWIWSDCDLALGWQEVC